MENFNHHHLRAWRAHMRYTQSKAADALQISLRRYKEWESGRVADLDKKIELACGALAHGIFNYRPGESDV